MAKLTSALPENRVVVGPRPRTEFLSGTQAPQSQAELVSVKRLSCFTPVSMAQTTTVASGDLRVAMYLFGCLSQKGGELRLESRHVPVRRLEPQRWRAAINGAHVQIVSEPGVSAPESQCTCSSARATTVASYDLRVAMDLFKDSNHNGGELRSGVPMSRLSLSQGSVHISRNVPVQVLEPQRWRATTWVAMYLFGCSSHKGGELPSGVPMSRLSLSQGSAYLSRDVPIRGMVPMAWLFADRLRRPTLIWPCMV